MAEDGTERHNVSLIDVDDGTSTDMDVPLVLSVCQFKASATTWEKQHTVLDAPSDLIDPDMSEESMKLVDKLWPLPGGLSCRDLPKYRVPSTTPKGVNRLFWAGEMEAVDTETSSSP